MNNGAWQTGIHRGVGNGERKSVGLGSHLRACSSFPVPHLLTRISQLYSLFGLVCMFTACSHTQTSPVDGKAIEQSRNTEAKLFGQWRCDRIESGYAFWKDIAECTFFVYEDKELPATRAGSPGDLLLAEMIITQGGTNRLADDTQPIFATRDRLYVGPIGSCYRFEYQLSARELRLKLLTSDGGHLRLHFIRIGDNPGKPRYPDVSKRWR